MVDQGETNCILGMTIQHDRQKHYLWIGQLKYLEGILHNFSGLSFYGISIFTQPLRLSRIWHKVNF